METVVYFMLWVTMCILVARLGKKRKIGFWWSLAFCLFLSPCIGLIITLFSKRIGHDIKFTDEG